MSFDLLSGTSFAIEKLGLECDPWSRPMGSNGLVVVPDKFDPTITIKLAPKAELALQWILVFFDDVKWIRPHLNPRNIESFLLYYHSWFFRGSPDYRQFVFNTPPPKFSSIHDMSRSELEEIEPWRDPWDPDNKTKVQVQVVVQDSQEEKTKNLPPNPLRQTTVKDDLKVWPNFERSKEDIIDLSKEVTPENTGMDDEIEEEDVLPPAPATTESILFHFLLNSVK